MGINMILKKIILLKKVLIVVGLIVLTACIESEDTGYYEGKVNLFNNSDTFQQANTARLNGSGNATSDPFEIEAVVHQGDTLRVGVAYSGGCEEHHFKVIWDGTILTSSPCRVDLIIGHDAQGDPCEGYIRESLIINLNQLIGENDEKDACIYNVFSMTNESDVPDGVSSPN